MWSCTNTYFLCSANTRALKRGGAHADQSSGRNWPNHPESSHYPFVVQDEVKKQLQQKPPGWLCEIKGSASLPTARSFYTQTLSTEVFTDHGHRCS